MEKAGCGYDVALMRISPTVLAIAIAAVISGMQRSASARMTEESITPAPTPQASPDDDEEDRGEDETPTPWATSTNIQPMPIPKIGPRPQPTPALPAGAALGTSKALLVWFIRPKPGTAYVSDQEVAKVDGNGIQALGDLTVLVGATGPGPITGVQIFVDNVLVAGGAEIPHQWRWKTSDEKRGLHELRAAVTDSAGTQRAVTLKVAVLGGPQQ